MPRAGSIVDGNVEVFRMAHATAARVASKSPAFRHVADDFAAELSIQANHPKVRRTGAYSRSFRVEKLRRDMMSDYYVYTTDPGQTIIEYGSGITSRSKRDQEGKYVFRAAIVVMMARAKQGS